MSKGDLYSLIFREQKESVAIAKRILRRLQKDCTPDEALVKDFTKGEKDAVLYKMKRHECHAILHHLWQLGIIKKEGELWCLDDMFLKTLENAMAQTAELHNLRVKIEYSNSHE